MAIKPAITAKNEEKTSENNERQNKVHKNNEKKSDFNQEEKLESGAPVIKHNWSDLPLELWMIIFKFADIVDHPAYFCIIPKWPPYQNCVNSTKYINEIYQPIYEISKPLFIDPHWLKQAYRKELTPNYQKQALLRDLPLLLVSLLMLFMFFNNDHLERLLIHAAMIFKKKLAEEGITTKIPHFLFTPLAFTIINALPVIRVGIRSVSLIYSKQNIAIVDSYLALLNLRKIKVIDRPLLTEEESIDVYSGRLAILQQHPERSILIIRGDKDIEPLLVEDQIRNLEPDEIVKQTIQRNTGSNNILSDNEKMSLIMLTAVLMMLSAFADTPVARVLPDHRYYHPYYRQAFNTQTWTLLMMIAVIIIKTKTSNDIVKKIENAKGWFSIFSPKKEEHTETPKPHID